LDAAGPEPLRSTLFQRFIAFCTCQSHPALALRALADTLRFRDLPLAALVAEEYMLGRRKTLKAKFLAPLTAAIVLLFSFAAGLQAQHVTHNDNGPPAMSVTLTAKNFQFDPAIIHIKVGQKVRLYVTAPDSTLGLRINPFPDGATSSTPPGLYFVFGEDCWKLRKGETLPIDVVGDTPGTYTFTCCKGCAKGHKSMKGQLIVDP
jgi:heme/copper-type cytochrome/quinol oxidase subunit 2